jgi:hypothetical protein
MAALFDSACPFWQGAPRSCTSVAIPKRLPTILKAALARSKYHIFEGSSAVVPCAPKLRNTNGQA